MSKKEAMVCRCEEVSREEIEKAIAAGDDNLTAIKQRTRAGMGFCQGRTCQRLVAQMIAAQGDVPVQDALAGQNARMPVGPLPLGLIADTVDGTEE